MAKKTLDKTIKRLIPSDILLKNIDRKILQNVINTLFEEGKKRSYISLIKSRINSIMKYAIKMQYIQHSEISNIEIPKSTLAMVDIEKSTPKFLDKEELKQLTDELEKKQTTEKYAIVARILFLTGLRYGEFSALRTQDIDFEKRIIKINGNYDFVNKKRTPPKNKSSIRELIVPKIVINLLHELHSLPMPPSKDNEKYFFIGAKGYPISSTVATEIFKKAGQRASIKKNITTHIFRHSHISLLSELGTPLPVIMERVGHSDSKTTLEIYTHVTKNMTKETVEKLEKIKL